MGFRDLMCFNLAMLAKIGWRVLVYLNSLLANTLRDKYFRLTDFMNANCGHGVSWEWKRDCASTADYGGWHEMTHW